METETTARPLSIGVFAHVDAGKTTFCEALLYHAREIAAPGRVDHQNSVLDHDALEKRRGITIFSDVAAFSRENRRFYLIDTPGHIDFSAEMERTLPVLDGAILLVSAVDGVQSHTLTLFELLRSMGIPLYLFFNKVDHVGADIADCLDQVAAKLTPDCLYLPSPGDLYGEPGVEWLCDYDEELMARYLEQQDLSPGFVRACAGRLVSRGTIVLAQSGSALSGEGVGELMETVAGTLCPKAEAFSGFAARVFKVVYDRLGNRVTFLKILSGALARKDEVAWGETTEKVHELRIYRGKDYTPAAVAGAGDIVGVTGLTAPPGAGLGDCGDLPAPFLQPALRASVQKKSCAHDDVMSCLRRLESQDPLLTVTYEPQLQDIQVSIMGKVQLEVLKDMIFERFGLDISFGDCKVLYKETVAAPVMGYGHYEPLRHYAEVHLRLEPNPGGGLEFASECHTDHLPAQYQNLIRHHVLEREHRGVLTGCPLSNVRFVLTNGAFHQKHTEGGDFREAAWRAVRQGLEKADSVLLEPFYAIAIDVDTDSMGRVLSDITRLHGEFEPPTVRGSRVQIQCRGPVETFLDYPAQLLSFTKGTGAISMRFLDYFPCHDPQRIIVAIGYERERDLENPSSSVFCARGAGFEVKWHEAEEYMHLLK